MDILERGDNDIVPVSMSATRTNISGCLTVVFESRVIFTNGEGWEASVSCIDRCQVIQSQLVRTVPAVMPADTGWIDACIGQEITFEGRGIFPQEGLFYSHANSSQYYWDFGDGSPRAEGKLVRHTYQESGGYLVQFTIIDQNGCINTNTIDQRVRISAKPQFTIAATPQICAGDTINLTGTTNNILSGTTVNANSLEGVFQPRYERSDSLFLPDGKGVAYETSVNITQFGTGQRLTDIDDLLGICAVMEHSYMRDLQISIKCPDGTTVMLQNFEAVGKEVLLGEPIDDAANLAPGIGYQYCWTPNATSGTWFSYDGRFLSAGQTLPPGDYNSFQSLDSLLGCPLNGLWTITVEDYLIQDNGYIFEWSIGFNPDLYPALEKFESVITDFGWETNSSTTLQATPDAAGENAYRFFTTDAFGCTYDTMVVVQALPPTHPDCYTCQELLTNVEDLVFCDNQSANVDVAINTPPQNIRFEAHPNYKQLNQTLNPVSAPFESSIQINSITPNSITTINQIVSICVDIETGVGNPISDLSLWLVSPDGKRIELSSNNGGNGTAYQQTCFTPTATTSIQTGTAPFTGNFLPEQNWDELLNATINGSWKLLVADGSGMQNGVVRSWSITFNHQHQVSYAWSAATELSCLDCPNPTISPSNNSITSLYTVTADDQYNCSASDTIAVLNINQIETPQLTCEITNSKALSFEWTRQTGLDYEISLDGQTWFCQILPPTNYLII
ncbi:MAG: PKD domain-containing protein [Saprospiraceae bacterium]|nr:PKD domain-containing protein [Saprospiraceae bacterium]